MENNVPVITICDIFMFKVRKTSASSLRHMNANVLDAVAECLDIEQGDKDKLLLFTLSRNNELHSVTDYNDGSFNNNINVILFAVNLYKLGLVTINMDSLANLDSATVQIEEWHEALKFFYMFQDYITNSNIEFCQVIERCLKNRYIEQNIQTCLDNNQTLAVCSPKLTELPANMDNISSIVDNLKSVGEYYTVQVCEKFKDAVNKFEIANILQEGETKHMTIGQEDIEIHWSVFHSIGGAGQELKPEFGELQQLGKGGFGSAYKFTPNGDDISKYFVIKSNCRLDNDNPKPAWHREVKHTRELCHPNIIKYYGDPIIYKGTVYNVMEYGGQSIYKLYHRQKAVPMAEIKKAMLQIASGVDYLHSEGIGGDYVVHRDLRSDNITVTDDGIYKIIDFGISSKTNVENSRFESKPDWGHPFWKSPEYCKYMSVQSDRENTMRPGRKSDVWSFGVLVLELMAFPGQPAYFTQNVYAYTNDLLQGRLVLTNFINDVWPEQVKVIVEKCLAVDEDARIDSSALKTLCQEL